MSESPAGPTGPRPTPAWQRLLAELKRRRVFRVAAVYGAVAFGVLQLADILVPALRLPESFTTGVAVVALLGFPIALVLAWAFETTPEGVRRTAGAAPREIAEIVGQPRAKRWPSGILALAGTAMLVVGGWLALTSRGAGPVGGAEAGAALAPSGAEASSLAVLPFTNLSGDPEAQPFTDGLHDDLLTQLSKIGSLKVISWTSVQEYRNTTKNVRQIADELRVAAVLAGGVQRAGNQVRMNVRLIDARTDTHMWAEQYSGDLTVANIFEIQSEIAGAIAEALRTRLTAEERERIARPPTQDLEAYEAYRKSWDFFRQRGYNESDLRAADQLAATAIRRDSSFAEAYAMRSVAASMLYWFHYDRTDSASQAALELARRALDLGPDLPEAHWALSHYHYRVDLDYEKALEEVARAQQARPGDAEFVALGGHILRRKGDMEEAVRRYLRAAELDPRSGPTAFSVGETLHLLRRYDEAEEWLRRAVELQPDFGLPYVFQARLRVDAAGDTAGARARLEEARNLGIVDDQREHTLADHYLRTGYPEAALAALRAAPVGIDNQFRYVPVPLMAALAWRGLGDSAQARSSFEAARTILQERVAADPSDARYHSALGLALAGLGQAEEAIREGEEGVRLMPPEREAWRGTYTVLFLARIYALTGRTEAAIDRLAYLLSIPGDLSVWELRLDPLWGPLRDDPRFQRLLQ